MNWDYFTMYPYQAGMALCLEPLVRLFGADPYPAFALCNALCAGACAAAAAVLAGLLQKGADRVCGLLCLLFFPLALSSSFLYGTMAGTACALWAVCGAVQLCRGGSRRCAGVSAGAGPCQPAAAGPLSGDELRPPGTSFPG